MLYRVEFLMWIDLYPSTASTYLSILVMKK